MNKRQVIQTVLQVKKPPYIPWSLGFTYEAYEKLKEHFGSPNLEPFMDNHLLDLGNGIGFFTDLGNNRVRDVFGVVWDRSVDKDIGIVEGQVLRLPTLKGYQFPNPLDPRFFEDIPGKLASYGDRYRVFQIGFSLYERAWTMRGLQPFYTDFYDNPRFVHELLNTIAEYNIAQVNEATKYEIDAVYFGDDWGQQHGLLMGRKLWKEFIQPALERMYGAVHRAGKQVFIHSCGDVDELFDTLIEIGVDCFNPFQPEVMDVFSLLDTYRGRLTFHGGLSTQRTLPYGTVADVQRETKALLEAGSQGNYIFSPAHAVEGDVPVENMLAFIEMLQAQPGYRESKKG